MYKSGRVDAHKTHQTQLPNTILYLLQLQHENIAWFTENIAENNT